MAGLVLPSRPDSSSGSTVMKAGAPLDTPGRMSFSITVPATEPSDGGAQRGREVDEQHGAPELASYVASKPWDWSCPCLGPGAGALGRECWTPGVHAATHIKQLGHIQMLEHTPNLNDNAHKYRTNSPSNMTLSPKFLDFNSKHSTNWSLLFQGVRRTKHTRSGRK